MKTKFNKLNSSKVWCLVRQGGVMVETFYTVITKYPSDIIYEDNSCIAKVVAADFKDYSWYIGMGEVIDKRSKSKCTLTIFQKKILFQRVFLKVENELFTDNLGFVKCNDENIVYNNFIELLEVDE